MKKRVLILMAMMGLVATMAACGDKETANDKKDSGNVESQVQKEETKEETFDSEYVTKQELISYLGEPVELTTENWKDYFEIIEIDEYTEDMFGEKEYTGKKVYRVRLKSGVASFGDGIKFRMKYHVSTEGAYTEEDKESLLNAGETSELVFEDHRVETIKARTLELDKTVDMSFNGGGNEEYSDIYSYNPNHYTKFEFEENCEKIEGKVITISIPDDRWKVNADGMRYFDYKHANGTTDVYIEESEDFYRVLRMQILLYMD